jgi:hypothetical protein
MIFVIWLVNCGGKTIANLIRSMGIFCRKRFRFCRKRFRLINLTNYQLVLLHLLL